MAQEQRHHLRIEPHTASECETVMAVKALARNGNAMEQKKHWVYGIGPLLGEMKTNNRDGLVAQTTDNFCSYTSDIVK